jgi:hypothetical protein
MQYSNKLFILLAFYFLSSLPTLADDIVISRKTTPGKALLDRKFIFMQEGSSFNKESGATAKRSTVNGQRISNDHKGLMTISTPAQRPSTFVHRSPITVHHSTSNVKPAVDNWDAYAEEVTDELEESLSVGARLLN